MASDNWILVADWWLTVVAVVRRESRSVGGVIRLAGSRSGGTVAVATRAAKIGVAA
ncbi:hypothetical protein OROGR_000733 [Orobanche gracilis]